MTPLIESTIVWLWLEKVHPDLPQLVKQKYGTELRNRTPASIKQDVALSMTSLLEELSVRQDAQVMRSYVSSRGFSRNDKYQPRNDKYQLRNYQASKMVNIKSCSLCKVAKHSQIDSFGPHVCVKPPFQRHTIMNWRKKPRVSQIIALHLRT